MKTYWIVKNKKGEFLENTQRRGWGSCRIAFLKRRGKKWRGKKWRGLTWHDLEERGYRSVRVEIYIKELPEEEC